MLQDSTEDDSEDTVYFTATRVPSESSLRSRQSYTRPKEDDYLKRMTSRVGVRSAGETTETETDDVSALPVARLPPYASPIIPPQILAVIIPYLYEFCRLLSVVPAVFGALYNIHKVYHLPESQQYSLQNTKLDYMICVFWAVLTGYQCLKLTTGLLWRWRAYYPPLSTLIRLVALQGICWPGTHITLVFFDHTKRPVLCWALIGTTTCFSRSVQLWVTSNIGREGRGKAKGTPRIWDWGEVIAKCALPAAVVYFVAMWVTMLKEELLCYSSHSPP